MDSRFPNVVSNHTFPLLEVKPWRHADVFCLLSYKANGNGARM